MEIEESVAAGDNVISRVRMRGTHLGAAQGFAPTCRSIDVGYIALER